MIICGLLSFMLNGSLLFIPPVQHSEKQSPKSPKKNPEELVNL